MKKGAKSFVQGAVILAVAGFIVKVIGAFFRVPLSNAIGQVGMSYYEVAYPYYSWLLVISSSGFPTAISKLVSERVALGDYIGARTVFRKAFVLLACIGLFTSLAMYFGADFLAKITTFEKAALSLRALAPALLLVSLMCAYRGYLQGMQQMTGTALSQLAEQLIKLVAGLTLAIKFLPRGPEYAAMGALIGVTISEFVALLVIILFFQFKKRDFDVELGRPHQMRSPQTGISKSLLAIAIPITVGASISPLSGIVDGALIGRILRGVLGYSEQAAQTAFSLLRTNVSTLVNMPGVITTALAMSLVPAISAAMTGRNYRSVRNATRLGLKLSFIIGLPCAVGLFILARPILSFLYANLDEAKLTLATQLMRTSAVGVIFLSLVQTMTGAIQGMGRPNVPVFNLFIGFVLKVVTLIILMRIPRINIQGAALSTVVCYAFAGLADMLYAIRITSMKVSFFDIIVKPVAASLAMGAVVQLCFTLLAKTGHEGVSTLISVLLGAGVYFTLLILLRMFSEEELNMIPGGAKLKKILYRSKN